MVHRVERENLNFGLRVCRIFSCGLLDETIYGSMGVSLGLGDKMIGQMENIETM